MTQLNTSILQQLFDGKISYVIQLTYRSFNGNFFKESNSVNIILYRSTRERNGNGRDVNECRVTGGHTAPLRRSRPLVELT